MPKNRSTDAIHRVSPKTKAIHRVSPKTEAMIPYSSVLTFIEALKH